MTPDNPGLELDPTEGEIVGRNPKGMTLDDFAALGHAPQPVLRMVRAKCVDCSGGKLGEVRRCVSTGCPLWPLRMGSNPFHGSASQAEKCPVDRPVPEAN